MKNPVLGHGETVPGVHAPSVPIHDRRAVVATATRAIASMINDSVVAPKIIFPMPNSVEYTATMPAIQFVHASAPPGIPSRPNPVCSAIRRQPGPPGRTRR